MDCIKAQVLLPHLTLRLELGRVAFDYELPFYTNKGIIKITDITGKILVTIPIVDSIGQKTWDVRNIKSGVYLYILEAGGTTKSGKLIIQ